MGIRNDSAGMSLQGLAIFHSPSFPQELFTRKEPFPHIGTKNGLIIRISSGKPDHPTGMRDMWQNLCTSCWELDPELRPDMMIVVSRIEEVWLTSVTVVMKM